MSKSAEGKKFVGRTPGAGALLLPYEKSSSLGFLCLLAVP
jgi:hypothetical protein